MVKLKIVFTCFSYCNINIPPVGVVYATHKLAKVGMTCVVVLPLCMYICLHTHTHIYIHQFSICIYLIYIYVCMYVYQLYIFIYVFIYIYISFYIYIYLKYGLKTTTSTHFRRIHPGTPLHLGWGNFDDYPDSDQEPPAATCPGLGREGTSHRSSHCGNQIRMCFLW